MNINRLNRRDCSIKLCCSVRVDSKVDCLTGHATSNCRSPREGTILQYDVTNRYVNKKAQGLKNCSGAMDWLGLN